VSLFDWEVRLSPPERLAREALLLKLKAAQLQAVSLSELDIRTDNPEGLIGHLIDTGEVVKIDRLFYSAENLDGVVESVRSHFNDNDELSPSDFKQITGLSRKGAIPMLEWLDSQGVTMRRGNARIMCR
jgi:selenocysteine-specific elongation factor